MNTTILILCAVVTGSSIGCLAGTQPPLSQMAVKVVDETGEPVSNAYVRASTYWKPGTLRGLTDTNGFFRYEDRVYQEIGYGVYKKGYYDSRGEAWWPKKLFEVPETNLVVELKRIIEPAKMTYHKVNKQLPRLDKPVPFDFEVGDWVFPDGKGKVADMWISGTNRWASRFDFDWCASLMVSNEWDGFFTVAVPSRTCLHIKSDLRPPQQAPVTGYISELVFYTASRKMESGTQNIESQRDDRIYIFRVRSVTNETGKTVSANVGWFEGTATGVGGGPVWGPPGSVWFACEYYYNPDPTSRSLEPKELADRQARDIPKDMK